jgi:hypothetical protein
MNRTAAMNLMGGSTSLGDEIAQEAMARDGIAMRRAVGRALDMLLSFAAGAPFRRTE